MAESITCFYSAKVIIFVPDDKKTKGWVVQNGFFDCFVVVFCLLLLFRCDKFVDVLLEMSTERH